MKHSKCPKTVWRIKIREQNKRKISVNPNGNIILKRSVVNCQGVGVGGEGARTDT